MASDSGEGSSHGKSWIISCCDPFKSHTKKIVKNLRKVTEEIRNLHPLLNLEIDDHLCDGCRKKVTKLPIIKETVTSSTSSSLSYTEDVCQAGTSGMNATRSEIPDF